jgi:hypothetical protein
MFSRWRVAGLIFTRVSLAIATATLLRILIKSAWTHFLKRPLPDLLLFPRLEIFAGLLTFTGVTQACAALMSGE